MKTVMIRMRTANPAMITWRRRFSFWKHSPDVKWLISLVKWLWNHTGKDQMAWLGLFFRNNFSCHRKLRRLDLHQKSNNRTRLGPLKDVLQTKLQRVRVLWKRYISRCWINCYCLKDASIYWSSNFLGHLKQMCQQVCLEKVALSRVEIFRSSFAYLWCTNNCGQNNFVGGPCRWLEPLDPWRFSLILRTLSFFCPRLKSIYNLKIRGVHLHEKHTRLREEDKKQPSTQKRPKQWPNGQIRRTPLLRLSRVSTEGRDSHLSK